MKRYLALILILGSGLFLMAMGDFGGTAAPSKIPSPEKNFNARVMDRQDIQTSLTQFSHDGKVYLAGKLGNATVTIPFEKISQIQFVAAQGKDPAAKVVLKDQKQIEILMDRRSNFYGQADFGTFHIEAKDLKSIRFQP